MKKIIISLTLLLLTNHVQASPYQSQISCPNVSAIIARGLNYITIKTPDNIRWEAAWLASDKYQTKQVWQFKIERGARGSVSHDVTEVEAMREANAALQTLRLDCGPYGDDKHMTCHYTTSHHDSAFATTNNPQ
jgi:hypothetical protein